MPKYTENDASSLYTIFNALIGESSKSGKPLIQDTILFDKDKLNFMHGPVEDGGRPYSGGCAVTKTKADEREVMNILRKALGFKNGETVRWRFEESYKDPHDNL